MPDPNAFRIMVLDLDTGEGKPASFGDRRVHLGGSGLAAALFDAYCVYDAPADDPRQPLIFAIGPLTGFFPLMSKVVCAFRSPYTGHYAESHAGGRMALAMRFSGYDGLVVLGRSEGLSVAIVGSRRFELRDGHFLRGYDNFTTGRLVRRMVPSDSGHRSIIRIGPAGENLCNYASINVDTFRHFGRLGGGAVMGRKNLKALMVLGDGNVALPGGPAYAKAYKDIYAEMTGSGQGEGQGSGLMRKYHDLGTPENLVVLNKLKALPWNNLKKTSDDGIGGISGERFADKLLLRKAACAGCPVGCIHVGLLRERFGPEHEYLYRQVSYDYEPIFANGSMLGLTSDADVLTLLDEHERQGLDVISGGVALAWATEAMERGIISEQETLVPLKFGEVEGYKRAISYLGGAVNEFWRTLARGTMVAAKTYGGEDYACVLGQEMAGYATGEVYFVSQAYGLRHSHLDAGGYSYDQKSTDKNAAEAVDYLVGDERGRVLVTCMVACLFSRQVYTRDRLAQAMTVIGYPDIAADLDGLAGKVQRDRWRIKFKTGYDPARIKIPKRYLEVETWKGKIDPAYLDELGKAYQTAIRGMAGLAGADGAEGTAGLPGTGETPGAPAPDPENKA